MKLIPKHNASKRTKNRLQEHNSLEIIQESIPVQFSTWKGIANLFRCTCHEANPWFGWLPCDEFSQV